MPRKSSAELAVAQVVVEIQPRQPAPAYLPDDQVDVWNDVISHQEAGWFNASNLPLLEFYCRHVAAGRKVGQLIAALEGGDELNVAEYDRLLKMQERESRAASSQATRMRLSQHASYDREKKNKAEVQDNPLAYGR